MVKEFLNEREFELINIVAGPMAKNQRDLSRQLNLSLGMTNMVLKRLVSKGYIRIQQLNQRKVQYLLTPKGFAEKMKKSIRYTLKTINSIALIKNRLKTILNDVKTRGYQEFWLVGGSDFSLLVEQSLKELDFNPIVHFNEEPSGSAKGVILLCKEDTEGNMQGHLPVVDIIQELSKDNLFIEHT